MAPARESTPLAAEEAVYYNSSYDSFDKLRDKVKGKLSGLSDAQKEKLKDEIKEYEEKAEDLSQSDEPRNSDVTSLDKAVTATQALDEEIDSVAASNGGS